jgi:hypothetical protein
MGYSGNLDWRDRSPDTIRGWTFCEDDTSQAVDVIILADGVELCTGKAQRYRHDLVEKGIHPTGCCGFEFTSFDWQLYDSAFSIKAVIANSCADYTEPPAHILSRLRTTIRIGARSDDQWI